MKADVQNVSGELIVSGLDSATSLIQAAKNLMNAVVLTVKASYVASTKYPRQKAEAGLSDENPVVVWKMKVRIRSRIGPGENQSINHSLCTAQVLTIRHGTYRFIFISPILILLAANTNACLRTVAAVVISRRFCGFTTCSLTQEF